MKIILTLLVSLLLSSGVLAQEKTCSKNINITNMEQDPTIDGVVQTGTVRYDLELIKDGKTQKYTIFDNDGMLGLFFSHRLMYQDMQKIDQTRDEKKYQDMFYEFDKNQVSLDNYDIPIIGNFMYSNLEKVAHEYSNVYPIRKKQHEWEIELLKEKVAGLEEEIKAELDKDKTDYDLIKVILAEKEDIEIGNAQKKIDGISYHESEIFNWKQLDASYIQPQVKRINGKKDPTIENSRDGMNMVFQNTNGNINEDHLIRLGNFIKDNGSNHGYRMISYGPDGSTISDDTKDKQKELFNSSVKEDGQLHDGNFPILNEFQLYRDSHFDLPMPKDKERKNQDVACLGVANGKTFNQMIKSLNTANGSYSNGVPKDQLFRAK